MVRDILNRQVVVAGVLAIWILVFPFCFMCLLYAASWLSRDSPAPLATLVTAHGVTILGMLLPTVPMVYACRQIRFLNWFGIVGFGAGMAFLLPIYFFLINGDAFAFGTSMSLDGLVQLGVYMPIASLSLVGYYGAMLAPPMVCVNAALLDAWLKMRASAG